MTQAQLQFQSSWQIAHFLRNQLQVDIAFLAPGLRCAPLYLAFKNCDLPLCSGLDERAMAFQALGHGQTRGGPAVIACTSGTAGAHFYPAIIEAYQARDPLVVLTCDRPQRLRGSDSAQTIDQRKFFGKYVCFEQSLELYQEMPGEDLKDVLSAMAQALHQEQRPVHLNLAYQHPLLDEEGDMPLPAPLEIPLKSSSNENDHLQSRVSDLLAQWKRPFVVVGAGQSLLGTSRELISWLQQLRVPFFADITSGAKTQTAQFDHSISSLDSPFVLDYLKEQVDGILHLEGALTSQNYGRMLDQLPRPKVVQLARHFADQVLSERVLHWQKIDHFPGELLPSWDFLPSQLLERERRRRKLFYEYAFSDPTHYHVVREVYEWLQEGDLLIVGNSTPIRSFNDYYYPVAKSIHWQFQRGVNGIEGFIARSRGAAMAHSGRVLCVLGDISAYHDFSSLVGPLPENLKVLILNNQRGGLFARLPVSRSEQYRKHLQDLVETPHDLNFSTLCGHWPTWDQQANSIVQFLSGPGQIWEFSLEHDKDLREWAELI